MLSASRSALEKVLVASANPGRQCGAAAAMTLAGVAAIRAPSRSGASSQFMIGEKLPKFRNTFDLIAI
jgi:hypothetical protein